MLTHHIQHIIIKRLISENALSFTELKPDDLDNKLFTYHLKITIREGLVEKINDRYRLTSTGRKLWKRISETPSKISERAISVIYVIIRAPDKGWLLYTRKTHPLKDRTGFMHAMPCPELTISDAASAQVLQKTGLICNFNAVGCGFFRTYQADELESFTNFTLLECTNPNGILIPNDPYASYQWVLNPNFSDNNMLPNMPILADRYLKGIFPFFIDESLKL